jgi:lysophospholipase L1-like esterase
MTRIVVCYGDSITRGRISANYVTMLKQRMARDNLRFLNSGVNNDVTYNLLRRIHPVIEVQPEFITVLVGTNDVIASLSPYGALFYYAFKRLPRWPSLEWSLASLRKVILRLKQETRAVIGLCSIPPLGENLNTFPNQRVRAYNAAVQEIAAANGLTYLPVFERFTAHLPHSDGREFVASVNMLGELMLRRYVFKEPFERFSRRKGFTLLTDGVHLNEPAAALVAAEIEGFLRERL